MNKHHLEAGFRQEAERQLNELESQLRVADENIKGLERERSQINAEVVALRSLLAIDDGEPIDVPSNAPRYTIDPRDVAIEILREKNGEEMHYKLLAHEVVQRGGHLPEKSPEAALNAIMNRDKRFVRPHRRGFYALREHHPRVKENAGRRHPRFD